MKIPITLLRRINVRMIIFFDDMLLMAQKLKEISQAKETFIFPLQNLGIVINFKKSQLTPVKETGVGDKFSRHDVSFTSGKSFGYPNQMGATYSVTKDHNYAINQNPRETLVHCSGSASSENSVQVLATKTNSGSERNKFLSNQSKIKPAVTGRVEVVEGELTSSEQQTTENRNATVNNSNGCFQSRLEGTVCQGTTTGELGHIRKGQNISIYWSSLQ